MPPPRLVTGLAIALLGAAGCGEFPVTGVGRFGEPIELLTDASSAPRLLVSPHAADQQCGDGSPTACTRVCAGPPHTCNAPGDCAALLIDSGSPLSVFPGAELGASRECVEVRRGTPEALDRSVVRFRFEGAPVFRVPASFGLGQWPWQTGLEGDTADVGAVLGGNILRHFAVRLSPSPSEVTFYEQYPGSEESLADQGWVYARLAYPNRLIGTRVDDACSLEAGLDCDLSQLPLLDDSRQIGFEATRMMVDACIAPPPCAPDWADENGRRTCDLRRGDSVGGCRDADDPDFGGKGASLVVATGSPDTVLFRDSAQRMFGSNALPACSERLTTTDLACDTETTSTLTVPGYAPMADVPLLRVRAIALLEGNTEPAGSGPCTRLQRRLQAARLSCEGLDEHDAPFRSLQTTAIDPDMHAIVIGETRWGTTTQSDVGLWLDVHVIPETSTLAMNLRREVGTDAIEPDGLLGTTLLDRTEIVLDYTEAESLPGLRVGCLTSGEGCLPLPACSGVDGEGDGRGSCCQGMPTSLILKALDADPESAAPCCSAFDPATLAVVQTAGVCEAVVKR